MPVTAFIGPSGCGKSTFLRVLNRMHELIPGGRVSGPVMLDGEDLYVDRVDTRPVQIPSVQAHCAGDMAAEDDFVHPVEGAQDRRFPTAGR